MRSIFDSLGIVIPPSCVVHAGIGMGVGAMHQWRDWDVAQAWLIDAEASQLAWTEQLAKTQSDWKVCVATLADKADLATFFHASNSAESGLLDPEKLRPLWPNLRTAQESLRQATTIDMLIGSHQNSDATDDWWLIVDCFPMLAILAGAQQTLERCSVLCLRTLFQGVADAASNIDEVEQFLTPLGFHRVQMIEGNHPAIGEVVYVRNWHAWLGQKLTAKNKENQLLIEQNRNLETLPNQIDLARAELAATQRELHAIQHALTEKDALQAELVAHKQESAEQHILLSERQLTIEAMRYENAMHSHQHALMRIQLSEKNAQIEVLKEESANLNKFKSDFLVHHKAVKAELDAINQSKVEQDSLIADLNLRLTSLAEEKAACMQKSTQYSEQLTSTQGQIDHLVEVSAACNIEKQALLAEKLELKTTNAEWQKKYELYSQELLEFQKQMTEAQDRLRVAELRNNELEQEKNKTTAEWDAKYGLRSQELLEFQKQMTEAQDRLRVAELRNNELEQEKNKTTAEWDAKYGLRSQELLASQKENAELQNHLRVAEHRNNELSQENEHLNTSKTALENLRVIHSKRDHECSHYQHLTHTLQTEVESLRSQIDPLHHANATLMRIKAELIEKLHNSQQTIAGLEGTHNELKTEQQAVAVQLKQTQDAAVQSFAKQSEQNQSLQEQIELLVQSRDSTCALLSKCQTEFDELQQANATTIQDKADLDQRCYILETEVRTITQNHTEQTALLNQCQSKIEELKQINANTIKANSELSEQCKNVQNEMNDLKQSCDKHSMLANKYQTETEQFKHANTVLMRVKSELIEKNQLVTTEHQQLAQEYRDQLALTQKYKGENEQLSLLFQQKEGQIAKLERDLIDSNARQRLLNDEMIKAEAQIELIKDVLLREAGL